jgi:RNA polymerase sigma-70 factor (ECF subfamily)
VYRRQARLPVSAPGTQDADETDARFTAEGRWREAPVPWPAPGVALESRQVQSAFEDCLNSLPATAARAFKMREMMGMEIGEIGEVLGVSADHCRALLYQARMRLRDLLEQRLFEGQESALD